MDKALLKEEYKRLLRQAVGDRTGSMALMMVLEEVDFYNCPASAKHHLNVPGGLLLHSLNVARTALDLCEKMPQFAKCDTNAVLTAALLHDVCKTGKYSTSRSRMVAISTEIPNCWATAKNPSSASRTGFI